MANEELTIAKEKARLTVIGNSYPDTLTDSGLGLDLSQIIFDILIDLGLDLPDIDFDDLDDITVIIGIDPDTEIVTLEYPDPDFDPDDLPDIIDYPLPDLDWDDFIDNLEDLGIDPIILTDLSFTGLNDLGIPELVFVDEDFNIQEDELPASIEIVTPPKKLEYQDGERIDLTGMVVTAKKSDGSTWTSAKYPNGHIPLGELIADPLSALLDVKPEEGSASLGDVNSMQYSFGPWGNAYWPNIVVWNAFGPLAVSFSGLDAQTGSPIHLSWDSEHKVWWGNIDLNGQNPSPIYGPVTLDAKTLLPYEAGDGSSSKRITVTWLRPGDSEPLSAYFDITVEPRRGNGGR